MFLLPSLLLGLVFAVLLGGRLSRLLTVALRLQWAVFVALAIQVAIFSGPGRNLGMETVDRLHLLSYALLIAFTVANLRVRTLIPVLLGLTLNAISIAANGGRMPVSPSAADAAAVQLDAHSSVSAHAERLVFLGDVFALPHQFPLANVFSIGDLLIGFGMAAFVVVTSIGDSGERSLSFGRLLQPFRVPDYRRLALGKLVSHFGDWLTLAALVGWIYSKTGSTGHVAAVLLFRLVPPILGGGIAAFVVDRLPKQRLIVWIEVGRGAALVAALAGVLTENTPLVLGALAMSGALAAMSGAAVPALVPSLLPAEQLPSANAGLGIAKDAAMAGGAVAAGLALSFVGAAAALAVDLVTFAVAIVLFAGLRAGSRSADLDDPDDPKVSGLRYLVRNRRLLVLVFSFATATLATGLTNASLPRFLEGEVGLGSGAYGFGMAALAAGLVLGEALVGVARVGPSAGRWIGGGLMVMAALLALLALVVHPPTALLVLFAVGFVDGTTDVLFETVVQREANPRYYGAVFGFSSAFMAVTMTSAFAAAPLANEFVEPHVVFLAAAAFLVVAGLIALIGMRRAVDSSSLQQTVARIHRPGRDLSLVAPSSLVGVADSVAGALRHELSIEVVVLDELGPGARAMLFDSVGRTSRAVVLHSNGGVNGLAAQLATTIDEDAFLFLADPVRRLSLEEDFVGGVLAAGRA